MTRLAAFVFSELAEVSATLASLGETRSGRARRAYFDVVRDAVGAAGGRELSTAGDGVLAVFGSASAALSFANWVQRGCDRESRRTGERLDVRVGIEVGETTADDASDAQGAAAATRALELSRAADSGVLASGIVAALGAGAGARFSPVGLLDLPGSSEPVRAFEVEWERPVVVHVPLPAELEGDGSRAQFVGRTTAMEHLRARWQLAVRGERQLAFVSGEPGIGKTRLASELARELHEDGAAVLWGRSSEEALSPYQPFVQALQHHVRSAPQEELGEQAGPGADLLGRLLPELRSRLSLPADQSHGDPGSGRYRLFEAVGRFLAAATIERPTLLVLDDLQWADQGTLLLLKHLARDPEPAQLLLVGTYRQTEVGRGHPLALMRADVERDRIVEGIDLYGLEEEEIATLVGSLVGWEPPDQVVRSLRDETEGNPLFLEEVVRNLKQLGVDSDPERLAALPATVLELGVPARVRELVGRRVQRLSPAARGALSAAAVIGNEFDGDVLAEVMDAAGYADLVSALDEAVEGRLLRELSDRVGRYRFSHALVQQALYEEQTLNRRAVLHEEVAATLERRRPGAPESHAEIAHHYARAGERHAAEVVRHGRAAGEHALTLLAYEDAITEFSAALAALDLLPVDDAAERSELLALLGNAQTRAGNWPAARAAFREAAELSAASGAWQTLAAAALGYGGGTHFGGVWENLLTVDVELVRLLELAVAALPAGDSRERVRLLGRLAQALYWSPDKERALSLSEEAVAAARRLGDQVALAHALDSRSVVLWSPDHLDERQVLGEEMLRLGRELRDRDIELEALCWLIVDALERGAMAVYDELVAEHGRLAAELRQPYHLWFTETLRVMRAYLDGRFDEADELCDRAYTYGMHVHESNASRVHLIQSLFLRLDRGGVEELLAGFEHEVEGTSVVVWRAAKALAFAELDRREEALEQVSSFAEQGFASIPRDLLWMTVLVFLGRAAGRFDDPTYADELYELLLPFADRICLPGGPVICLGPVSETLGMLARAVGRPEAALVHFADALERSRALGSPPLVARAQVGAARTHLLRQAGGDRVAAEGLLEEAAATATACRMERLLRDVDTLQASLGRGALA